MVKYGPQPEFMIQFHISQVVFIIPRIRSDERQASTSLLIVFPFRGPPAPPRHLHSRRQLCHLNFSSADEVGPKKALATNYRFECDAFQLPAFYIFYIDEYRCRWGPIERLSVLLRTPSLPVREALRSFRMRKSHIGHLHMGSFRSAFFAPDTWWDSNFRTCKWMFLFKRSYIKELVKSHEDFFVIKWKKSVGVRSLDLGGQWISLWEITTRKFGWKKASVIHFTIHSSNVAPKEYIYETELIFQSKDAKTWMFLTNERFNFFFTFFFSKSPRQISFLD